MSNLILNRDFKLPDDGWYHIAPLGEFLNAEAGVMQVIDREACEAMAARFGVDAAAANFPGLLIDFDHFSLVASQRSEAAGWIIALEARCQRAEDRGQMADRAGDGPQTADARPQTVDQDGEKIAAAERASHIESQKGLWAQIRWSDLGEEAVKGGRYRFLSPVWARRDCVELGFDLVGHPRVRPIRMENAAVTNEPGLRGMVPLSNRGQRSEDGGRRTDGRGQRADDSGQNTNTRGGSVDFSGIGDKAKERGGDTI